MKKKKFIKTLAIIFVSCLITLVGVKIYEELNVEKATSVYDLYNYNIPKKEKVHATNILKKSKVILNAFQAYSSDINFNNMYSDSVLAGASKKTYIDKLNNKANKSYYDIIKKYLKFEVIHIHKGAFAVPKKKDIRFVLNISVQYVDIENNYKIYKNKQLLGTVGPNVDFKTYLDDPNNIQLSQTFITDYYVDYIGETKKYQFKAPDRIIYYMFQVKSNNQNIDEMISEIVYDISNQPNEDYKNILPKAKEVLDKELALIKEKDAMKVVEYIKENPNGSGMFKGEIIEYAEKFKVKYARTEIVKFLLDTNEYEFIGYNNKKNTVVYSIYGYNYDELVKMFKTNEKDGVVDDRLNYRKFEIFKQALANNEFVKDYIFIEVPVNSNGECRPLLPFVMPSEENMWAYDTVEYSGLQGIDVNKVPQDYKKYFSVTTVPGFANRAAVVYISKDSYNANYEQTGNWSKYNEDCRKAIIDALKIILGYEENVNNTVFVNDFNKLTQSIYQSVVTATQETTTIINAQDYNLNGVQIRLTLSTNSFAMAVRVNKWEGAE